MNPLLRILFSISLLGWAGSGWADPPTDTERAAAEEHSRLGVEYYAAGNYPEAIREMLLALQIVHDPRLVYNVARIYQAMEETELAIEYHQRFVRDPEADPETVQLALQHLTELRALEQEPPEVAEIESEPINPEPVVQPSTPELPEALPTSTGLGAHHILLGTGVASVATGGVFGWQAFRSQNQYADSTLETEARLAAADVGQRQAMVADLTLVGGALLIGGGVWMSVRGTTLRVGMVPGAILLSSGTR